MPTPDHFGPLLYLAGIAKKEELPRAMVRGYSLASLSMTCYAVGADIPTDDQGAGAAALPGGIPPDDTNT